MLAKTLKPNMAFTLTMGAKACVEFAQGEPLNEI